MVNPLPPLSGRRTSESPKLIASTRPIHLRPCATARIRAIARKDDRIRFIAKPISRLSVWAALRIDRGNTASVSRAEPRRCRASKSIHAAINERRPALT